MGVNDCDYNFLAVFFHKYSVCEIISCYNKKGHAENNVKVRKTKNHTCWMNRRIQKLEPWKLGEE